MVSLQPTGEKFARFLKLDGFCFAHNVDCWKETYYVGNVPEYSASLMNGAWACAHLMDSYRFTGDKAFLKKSIPILESNARFIMSWFQKDGKGALYLRSGNFSGKHLQSPGRDRKKNQPFRLQRLFP